MLPIPEVKHSIPKLIPVIILSESVSSGRYQIIVGRTPFGKYTYSLSNVRLKVEYEKVNSVTLELFTPLDPFDGGFPVEAGTRDLHFFTQGGSGDVDFQVRSPRGLTYRSENHEEIFYRDPVPGKYMLDPYEPSYFDFIVAWEPPLFFDFERISGGSHTCGISLGVPGIWMEIRCLPM